MLSYATTQYAENKDLALKNLRDCLNENKILCRPNYKQRKTHVKRL